MLGSFSALRDWSVSEGYLEPFEGQICPTLKFWLFERIHLHEFETCMYDCLIKKTDYAPYHQMLIFETLVHFYTTHPYISQAQGKIFQQQQPLLTFSHLKRIDYLKYRIDEAQAVGTLEEEILNHSGSFLEILKLFLDSGADINEMWVQSYCTISSEDFNQMIV